MADKPTNGFDRLHPAVQHHVVNSLGWRTLRPLQEATIGPILDGEHIVAMAPTAGGKTEAAIFPVLSAMLTEQRRGLSVLYVCPLRALLNNLHVRLSGYAELVGRTVGLWHGDVTGPQRKALLANPPDILLTTPESLESMLVSTGVDQRTWFAGVRTVIVDEAHAFAADDRGWHLLAVLARLSHLTGRELQRIALSATIGNPDEVLEWLTVGCERPGRVINPPTPAAAPPQITLDYVGNLDNAAVVISRLHRGAKRLVFTDSRARAEQLAAALRANGVTTFLSHGSLGLDERRQAEGAFADARDCVIVATSTLELGIDVGDLDHVLQIDSPSTVASFLQRLGRSGRRTGTVRNMTFLATSDDALLLGAAVLLCWERGYVEPTNAPPQPMHLLGQQLLALALQERVIGRHTWQPWLGSPCVLGLETQVVADDVMDHLLAEGFLVDTGHGMLTIGAAAEAEYGRRHFMELLAVFTAPLLLSVRHGRTEIGRVPDELLAVRPASTVGTSGALSSAGGSGALLLAGRNWAIRNVDWRRRVVEVEPTDRAGVARWTGGSGVLGSVLTRTVRDVLTGAQPEQVLVSQRAQERLNDARATRAWVQPQGTVVVVGLDDRVRWWTFAGRRANLWLAALLAPLRGTVLGVDDFSLALDPGTTVEQVRATLANADLQTATLAPWISSAAIDNLKFAEMLPGSLAVAEVEARLRDDHAVLQAIAERTTSVHVSN